MTVCRICLQLKDPIAQAQMAAQSLDETIARAYIAGLCEGTVFQDLISKRMCEVHAAMYAAQGTMTAEAIIDIGERLFGSESLNPESRALIAKMRADIADIRAGKAPISGKVDIRSKIERAPSSRKVPKDVN